MLLRTNTGELSSPRIPPLPLPQVEPGVEGMVGAQYLPWRSHAESTSLPMQRPHSSCRELSAGAALQLTPLQAIYPT